MSDKASGAHPEEHQLHAPGLKRRQRKEGEARYWLPRPKDIEAGYPLKSLTIPATASEAECAALCRKHQGDLERWRKGETMEPTAGTWKWACWRYRHDELSRYHGVGDQTRRQYDYFCDTIETTIGARTIAGTNGEDLMRWYGELRKPATEGGPERLMRARGVMGQIRRVAKHALFVGYKPAIPILELYDKEVVTFETGRARETAPTPEQVLAIVREAIRQGWKSIAKTTLGQFEFTERRVSIIGKFEGEQWVPGWVWEAVIDGSRQGITPDWKIVYYQNKVGRRRREYDLNDTPLLLELLQETPPEQRAGPVIVREDTGLPWKARDYAHRFREIARAAGVPDDVWSMDMRAGGAVEADGILGLTEEEMMAAGAWSDRATMRRYTRGGYRDAQNVVKLRQKARASEA